MFKGIKLKMTVAIVAAVLVTAALLIGITSVVVAYTLKVGLHGRARETSKILAEALSGRERQLAARVDVMAQDETFKARYAFKDDEPQALKDALGEMMEKTHATFSVVTDLQGTVVSQAVHKGSKAVPTGLNEMTALQLVRSQNTPTSTIEHVGDQTLFVAAAPILRYGAGSSTLGYLALATAFDDALLTQLKNSSGAEIFLVRDASTKLSTAALQTSQTVLSSIDQQMATTNELLPLDGLSVAGQPLLAYAMGLRAGNKYQAALIFGHSYQEVSALQRRIGGISFGLAFVATLLAGFIGLIIARRISDPIVEIEQSFYEIAASGDLSRRITKGYPDEIGRMATSFNQMQQQIERLHARVVTAEQRMRSELSTASAVQEMLFPSTVIEGARCQFASHAQASTETGGDWFTIINTPEHHQMTVVISDVTGHGASAALVTAILHGFFKAVEPELAKLTGAQWQQGVDSILRRLNHTVIESTRRSLTSSLFLLTFDHRTLRVRYANAGHIAPLLVRRTNGQAQVSIIPTPPSSLIGDLDDPNFSWGEIQLHPEHLVVLFTDGLVECTNANTEQYGFKRLRRTLSALVEHQDARTVRDLILQDAFKFFGDTPLADDISLLVGRVR